MKKEHCVKSEEVTVRLLTCNARENKQNWNTFPYVAIQNYQTLNKKAKKQMIKTFKTKNRRKNNQHYDQWYRYLKIKKSYQKWIFSKGIGFLKDTNRYMKWWKIYALLNLFNIINIHSWNIDIEEILGIFLYRYEFLLISLKVKAMETSKQYK